MRGVEPELRWIVHLRLGSDGGRWVALGSCEGRGWDVYSQLGRRASQRVGEVAGRDWVKRAWTNIHNPTSLAWGIIIIIVENGDNHVSIRITRTIYPYYRALTSYDPMDGHA